MKILFLDIDGVLCSLRVHLAMHGPGGAWNDFDPVACAAIRRVCETGVKIVISSSWRHGRMNEVLAGLYCAGLSDYLHEDSTTPDSYLVSPDGNRGTDIAMWLNKHLTVEDYVILDDDSDMLPDQFSHLVQTDGFNGLTHANIKELYRWAGLLSC